MGAAYHAWERDDRRAEFERRGIETPEQLAAHIEAVQNHPDTKFAELAQNRVGWANSDERLAGVVNPNDPERSTVIPRGDPEYQLDRWAEQEADQSGFRPDIQNGPLPERFEPAASEAAIDASEPSDPEQVRAEDLEQRAKVEAAYVAAEERLEALQTQNASEADIDAADAECIKLSGAVRDIDHNNIRDAARDPSVLPLFDSMAEEIDDLREEYAADNERLAMTADAEGWDTDRRAEESSKLEANWDDKLDTSYPLSDGTGSEAQPGASPSPEPGIG